MDKQSIALSWNDAHSPYSWRWAYLIKGSGTYEGRSYSGFTLVELIVVITILAILGTIGFISLVGYFSYSRDSARLSDIDTITKALDITKEKTGRYPDPSSYKAITYSWGLVWNQGTIGDSVIRIIGKISKKPTDPKYPTVEYTYSLLGNNKEYQIAGVIEGTPISYDPIVTTTYALTDSLTAYIKWNYNGLMATSQTAGWDTCILALPSIILQDINDSSGMVLNSGDIIQKNNLVLQSKSNIPWSYLNNAIFTATGWQFAYIPLQNGNNLNEGSGITVYCSGNLPSDKDSLDTLIANLKDIYGSSGVSTDTLSAPQVASFMISTSQDAFVANILQTSFNMAKIDVSKGGSSACLNLPSPWDFTFSAGTITGYSWPTDVVIPCKIAGVSVTSIDMYAFAGLGLTSIVIPNSITSIWEGAFGSNQLTSIVIPASVTDIWEGTFSYNQLTNVTIPSSVTSVWKFAFNSNQLTNVTIPNGVTSIWEAAFDSNQIASITIPGSVTNIWNFAFNSNKLTSITIPGSVTNIWEYAFQHNFLTSLTIQNGVTIIWMGAFGYNQLTSVTIPSSVTSIWNDAFALNQLTSVTIPNSVISIGNGAFYSNQLTNITIPSSVTSVWALAFYSNKIPNLSSVVVHCSSVTLPSFWVQVFNNNGPASDTDIGTPAVCN